MERENWHRELGDSAAQRPDQLEETRPRRQRDRSPPSAVSRFSASTRPALLDGGGVRTLTQGLVSLHSRISWGKAGLGLEDGGWGREHSQKTVQTGARSAAGTRRDGRDPAGPSAQKPGLDRASHPAPHTRAAE